MADDKEIEIEVTEEDPKTHVKTKKKITIKKKAGKAEADLGSKTLTGLKKSKPPVPPKKEPTKVSGRYHPNWGADDRDVTIVIDCDANPPTVEVVVTYAEGTDKGKRDEENCHKYEIDPRECKKAKDFVEGLDVPYLVALGPAVGDRYMADWIGPALEALAVVLIEVGEALRSSRPVWLAYENDEMAFVSSVSGVSVRITHHLNELQLLVAAEPGASTHGPVELRDKVFKESVEAFAMEELGNGE